jgi:hypothetical protein
MSSRRALLGIIVTAMIAGAIVLGQSQRYAQLTKSDDLAASGAAARVSVQVAGCPTILGAGGNGAGPTVGQIHLPKTIEVAVPKSLARSVVFYADEFGVMHVLAPKGWHCVTTYGADGSGGLTITPPGQSATVNGSFLSSQAEAVTTHETSACVGCEADQVCPIFTYAIGLGSCPDARPGDKTVNAYAFDVFDSEGSGTGTAEFYDPPYVAGDGDPSGGPYPAIGAMTYYPDSHDGSWMETCTLPASDEALCTDSLGTFMAHYGTE